MNFDQIFKHILRNSQSYSGKQHQPNINKKSGKELDPLAQYHIIIDNMISNIHTNLLKGKSVFLKSKRSIYLNF